MTRLTSRSATPAAPSRRRGRTFAVVILAAGLMAACSSSSEGPVAAPDSSTATASESAGSGASSPATASASAGSGSSSADAVVATIPPNLPEDLVGEVGEVEIIGEPLPRIVRGATIETDPGRGVKAPILVGTDFAGDPIRVDPSETGRPALIVFLAHWCSHCNAEVPILNDLRDSNAFRPDLDIYGVSSAVNPSRPNFPPSQWVKDVDWTYPTIIDGVVVEGDEQRFFALQAFGDGGFPMAVLINADGTVAARWTGEVPGDVVISNIETYLAY